MTDQGNTWKSIYKRRKPMGRYHLFFCLCSGIFGYEEKYVDKSLAL